MIACVAVELDFNKELEFLIPAHLSTEVDEGTLVLVPLGNRKVIAKIVGFTEKSPNTKLKPLLKVIHDGDFVAPNIMELTDWIAGYYCVTTKAFHLVFPRPVRQTKLLDKNRRHYVRTLPVSGGLQTLPERERQIWEFVEQRKILLIEELTQFSNTTAIEIRRLEEKGLIAISNSPFEFDSAPHGQANSDAAWTLDPTQTKAMSEISSAMDGDYGSNQASGNAQVGQQRAKVKQSRPFLLHDLNGNGKNEVYLQAMAHAIEKGKGTILIVPEITLTPQFIERYKSRFNSGSTQTLISVLHNHLSFSERYDEFQKIRCGDARIVIGSSAAIFAPVNSLGLIIVDDEHDEAHKLPEPQCYNARDTAIMRGQMENTAVVLGSATPSLETYLNCRKGKYALLELPERSDKKKLPQVRVVDMRQKVPDEKNIPIFSPQLKEAMAQRLERGEQSILFLNRRGYSTQLQCILCGFVAVCPFCSEALTYHRPENNLRCHICGHSEKVPAICPVPKCKNPAIRYSGIGTQRVEEVLAKLFPKARIQRMDSDILKHKKNYRQILENFRADKIDILVGTQMIVRGLDFPNVTLVGIIYADMSLHRPDFRAGERTFQLLTQLINRAARDDVKCELFVQTFSPFHPAIQYARRRDFTGFYEQEIEFREQLKYPPFNRVALLTLRGRNEEKAKFCAEYLKRELEKCLANIKDLILSGPAPAPLLRGESFYRYQIMLRVPRMVQLSQHLTQLTQSLRLPEDILLTLDIDPVELS